MECSEPCIKDTLHLWDVIQEMDCLRHAECLWARGMLPACMGASGRFSDEPVAVWSTPNFARALAAAGDVHPDGSGGPAWAAKRAPRAGAGAAVIDTARHSMHEDLFVVHDVALSGSNVTGRQTVPRAELQAILNVVGLLPQDMKQLHIHPDATYTANGLMPDKRELRQRMEHGTNADLWIQLKDLEGRLGLVLSGHRTPAHTSPDDLVEMRGPPLRDFLGNLLADAAAGASAKAALRAAPVDVRTAKRWEERAVAIARRLAHLEVLRWAEGVHLVPDVDPLEPHVPVAPELVHSQFRHALQDMGHQIVRRDGGCLLCTLCRKQTRKGLASFCWRRCPQAHLAPTPAVTSPQPTYMQDSQQTITNSVSLKTTPAKRRVKVAAQQKELKRRRVLDLQGEEDTARVIELGTPRALAVSFPMWRSLPPVEIHREHTALVCGGYAGCVKCGSTVAFHSVSLLKDPCRGWCPAGSRRPVRRLAGGQHPRDYGEVCHEWPSGELNPKVYLYQSPGIAMMRPDGS